LTRAGKTKHFSGKQLWLQAGIFLHTLLRSGFAPPSPAPKAHAIVTTVANAVKKKRGKHSVISLSKERWMGENNHTLISRTKLQKNITVYGKKGFF
jgi:hypothetical protein